MVGRILWTYRKDEVLFNLSMFNKTFNKNYLDNYTEFITDAFKSLFSYYGYIEHPTAPIISEVDKSVYFIGSTISIFKPYILSKKIPESGYFLIQECLRTQNISTFLDDDVFPKWASYFSSMGTISPIENIQDVSLQTWEFFSQKLNINSDRIAVRISSSDSDLLHCWRKIKNGPRIEIDTIDQTHYRHRYGLETIRGRNLNIAIRQETTGVFEDIGNMIIIENMHERIAVELAFGVTTLLARIFSLKHPLMTSKISKVMPLENNSTIKLADALTVTLVLLRNGLKPTASDHRGRILRGYLQSLSNLRKKADFSVKQIEDSMGKFEVEEYGTFSEIPVKVRKYLIDYENLTIGKEKDINKKLKGYF